ncbi:hypothetical protein [Rhodopseudomonas sp. P2A-2r]|uniref:hypothetical protein n=1 Tax=unclassified Rhodopseudomonas TaxID=2638247 RepID=UPI002234BC9D|nr:hypothetical protein [Rhodopseudomonas sp. P2A-2r]UZE49311.1 hypothetical protein ONR75_00045 [Rhodopseudomonas sp. P2A-2r]
MVLILETVARTLERLGHTTADAKNGVDLVVDGEKLRLLFHETKDKSEHHPTAGELAEKATWDANRLISPTLYNSDRKHWRSWDHFPSGRISLTLVSPSWTSWSTDRILGRWHDRKAAALEQQLNEVVVAMYAGVALLKHNRAKLEERQRLHQEEMERRERERARQDRIAKREAFVRQKAKEHAELVELRSFSRHLDGETAGPDMRNAAAIAAVTRDMIDRLENCLSGLALDEEIKRLKLYADGDLAQENCPSGSYLDVAIAIDHSAIATSKSPSTCPRWPRWPDGLNGFLVDQEAGPSGRDPLRDQSARIPH